MARSIASRFDLKQPDAVDQPKAVDQSEAVFSEMSFSLPNNARRRTLKLHRSTSDSRGIRSDLEARVWTELLRAVAFQMVRTRAT